MLKTLKLSAISSIAAFSAYAEPPAWLISDEDSQMVLFPTVHALPDGIEWKTGALDTLIRNSDEVWTEIGATGGPDFQAEIQQLIGTYGMSPDTPLSSQLDEAELAGLNAALEELGVPLAALETMKPWLAALMLTQADLAKAGFSGDKGVEAELTKIFGDREVRNLETAADQTRLLADLTPDLQVDFLMSAADSVGEAADQLKTVATDWSNGDLTGMEEELIAEMKSEWPTLYNAVFTARNAKWAETLAIELEGSGSDFIAVGAGHLVGDDSVQNMLDAKGYTVRQISLSEGF